MDATPLDEVSDIKIEDNGDHALKSLMDELRIPVPDYIQENRISISKTFDEIEVLPENVNHREIKHVELLIFDEKADMVTERKPYRFKLSSSTSRGQLRLYFESEEKTPLEIDFDLAQLDSEVHQVVGKFNSLQKAWTEIKFQP